MNQPANSPHKSLCTTADQSRIQCEANEIISKYAPNQSQSHRNRCFVVIESTMRLMSL